MMTNAEAAQAIHDHHAEMSGALRERVAALTAAVRGGDDHALQQRAVGEYLTGDLLPHAQAEEAALYPAGRSGATAMLVSAMLDEHRDLVRRVDAFARISDGVEAVAAAGAILALFESHLAKENDRLIPAIADEPNVSLARLLEGMHELLGAASAA